MVVGARSVGFLCLLTALAAAQTVPYNEGSRKAQQPAAATVPVGWLMAPRVVQEEVLQAQELRKSRRCAEASGLLHQALRRVPQFPYALNELALCSWIEGDAEQAVALFDAALAGDPQYLDPYLQKADLLRQRKHYREAIRVLAAAGRALPQRAEPYYFTALIHWELRDFVRARKACQQVLQRSAYQVPEVHVLLADIYARQYEPALATKEVELYLAKAPNGEFADEAHSWLRRAQTSAQSRQNSLLPSR